MVFFVQKALEELELVETLTLGAEIPGVMYGQAEFMSEWDKFYRRHQFDDDTTL
ncbi:MAG: hypothetical protein H7Y11_02405 [Armatimonadetes bacterium]|nr:hypothetical protein [Anaerolineae bacterium]